MKYLKSSKIYFEDGVRSGYLVIDGKKIVGYLDDSAKVEDYEDYKDNRIIPGICDTHNHGTYGYSLDSTFDGDEEKIKENIRNYLHCLTYEGVTSGFPTVVDTIKQLAEVAKEGNYNGISVLGIHAEGPYLSRVGENGRPEPHPPVDMDFVKSMWEDSQGLLSLVAMAPEIEDSDKAAKYLLSKGVRLAFAHSDLKMAGARKAIDDGYSVATHTSNVMVGIHHRDIGGLGVMLDDDRVQCEIICDGLHNCLEWIKLMLKMKSHDKFMMISDSVSLAGQAVGRYDTHEGGIPLNITPEGFAKDDDGRLCGSTKSVLYGISNLVEKLHMPLEEVIKLSSLNACTFYGYGDTKGSIKIGKDADIVVISDDYKALATYVEGTKVFDRKTETPTYNPHPKETRID